ncbi:hypothetical protein BDN72DRAFT_877708 [Pluteus cervinus]|uniref:Uncharacterized protein n=1 Tax=Pluteus cervinus TaxID=181527 RepID=A0ACD3AZ14_9AGAR|nr:hypothetical protein BDN72DRAFT_877708 [Pluteus cervinus]
MNRPGQPQQRPPSLAPNPGLAGQFRPPYPAYGMPPRNVNVLPTGTYVPGLQPSNHRTPSQQPPGQNMLPQPAPGFIQRAQNSFAFGGGLGQHQTTNSLQQQQQPQPPSQQQQTNGTSNSLPPHLSQTPLGTAPPVSSANDVGLDPNDFPALGSTPSSNNPGTTNASTLPNSVTASYASQAGTGVPLGGAGSSGAGTLGGGTPTSGTIGQTRDFTPDDFPALGGQTQPSSQNQNSSQPESHPHPPGLNGFQQHNDQVQQHRPSLAGQLGGTIQQSTPGMLNIGAAQARSIHPGFQQQPGQSEADKQHRPGYATKLNQALHAWNTPSGNPSPQLGTNNHNGSHANPNPSTTHLNAPPGVPLPAAYNQSTQTTHSSGAIANLAPGLASYQSNGLPPVEPMSNPGNANPNPNNHITSTAGSSQNVNQVLQGNTTLPQHHPQTPAQQVLMSAADRWGLLGLLAMIKNAGSDLDQGLTSVGTDLGAMGLDMSYSGNLYSTFITPWSDQSAAHAVEPDFHLPPCYAVQTQPPGPTKTETFSEETLFFMFYSSPRDALQEVAAQELYNRTWRYHKELRLWIIKEVGSTPSQKVPGGEQGLYTYWDYNNWSKERKEMTVLYGDLEEKSAPAFLPGPGLVPTPQGQSQAAVLNQQQQQQQQQQPNQLPSTQRGAFQMGMAGL